MRVQKRLQIELKNYITGKDKKDLLKNKNKRSTNWLRKTGYLDLDDLATVDYNNDVNLGDVTTVDYNMDTQPSELDNEIDKRDLKNN